MHAQILPSAERGTGTDRCMNKHHVGMVM